MFFRVCQNVFLHTFFKEPRENIWILPLSEYERWTRKKWNIPKCFFPSLSYYLVTGNFKFESGACQEESFHLELGWNIPNSVIRELY